MFLFHVCQLFSDLINKMVHANWTAWQINGLLVYLLEI